MGTRAGLDVEVFGDCLTEQRGIPEAFSEQFLVEKLLGFRCDQRRLTGCIPVGEANLPQLLEARQIVVNGLDVGVNMLCQLSDCPASAVHPQQTDPEPHFGAFVNRMVCF